MSKVPVKARSKAESDGAVLQGLSPVSWPTAGSADSDAAGAAPGGLPVWVLDNGSGDTALRTRGELAAAASGAVVPVHVTVADQHAAEAAGARSVVLQVSRADGRPGRAGVGLAVNYAKFASAYGADYGSRLRLVSLRDCALTTPSVKACQEQRLCCVRRSSRSRQA